MKSKKMLLMLLTVLFAERGYAGYEAHEWGTFTSVLDSTGVTQNGMYHEDEALPEFVHGFGELRGEVKPVAPPIRRPRPPCHSKICFDQSELSANQITQKMETPVIYFYSDTSQRVDVNVKFPEGIITETYPGPVATFPTMQDPHIIGKGESTFSVNILTAKTGPVPFADPENIYSHARKVASNLISSGAELEKFIFYRGLGRFQPKISITSKAGNLKIGNLNSAKVRPQMAFLVHVDEEGNGQLMSLESVKIETEVLITDAQLNDLKSHSVQSSPFVIKGEQARGKLIDELIRSGLFKDEAIAMINTWENGYLKVPGLRLLYILPRAEVDEVLPLKLNPLPEKLVRSFVARMEILLDTDEQRILKEIETQRDKFKVASLGRFAEPILHRIKAIAAKTQNTDSQLLNILDQHIKEAAVNFEAKTSVH